MKAACKRGFAGPTVTDNFWPLVRNLHRPSGNRAKAPVPKPNFSVLNLSINEFSSWKRNCANWVLTLTTWCHPHETRLLVVPPRPAVGGQRFGPSRRHEPDAGAGGAGQSGLPADHERAYALPHRGAG